MEIATQPLIRFTLHASSTPVMKQKNEMQACYGKIYLHVLSLFFIGVRG